MNAGDFIRDRLKRDSETRTPLSDIVAAYAAAGGSDATVLIRWLLTHGYGFSTDLSVNAKLLPVPPKRLWKDSSSAIYTAETAGHNVTIDFVDEDFTQPATDRIVTLMLLGVKVLPDMVAAWRSGGVNVGVIIAEIENELKKCEVTK